MYYTVSQSQFAMVFGCKILKICLTVNVIKMILYCLILIISFKIRNFYLAGQCQFFNVSYIFKLSFRRGGMQDLYFDSII